MVDRRRTPRYMLETPLRADAMPMENVTVEQISAGHIVVISPSAHDADEDVMIHMPTPDGLRSQAATVLSSEPVSTSGGFGYRLELRVADAPEKRGTP